MPFPSPLLPASSHEGTSGAQNKMSRSPMGHSLLAALAISISNSVMCAHSSFLSLLYFNIYSFIYGPQVHRFSWSLIWGSQAFSTWVCLQLFCYLISCAGVWAQEIFSYLRSPVLNKQNSRCSLSHPFATLSGMSSAFSLCLSVLSLSSVLHVSSFIAFVPFFKSLTGLELATVIN